MHIANWWATSFGSERQLMTAGELKWWTARKCLTTFPNDEGPFKSVFFSIFFSKITNWIRFSWLADSKGRLNLYSSTVLSTLLLGLVLFFSSAASTVCNPPLPDCCCSQTVSYEATGLRKQSDICFLPALVRMNFSSIVGLAEDEIERSKNFLLICKRLSKWFDFRFYLVIAII